MGKLSLVVLVAAAVLAKVASEDAILDQKLEVKTDEKQDTVVNVEPSQDVAPEDRRAYGVPLPGYGYAGYAQLHPTQAHPGYPATQPQASLNAAARTRATAQGQGYAPVGPPATTVPPAIINCFSCHDCPHVTKDTPTKMCPPSFDPAKSGKCLSYATKYDSGKKWFVHGCASDLGTCQDVKNNLQRYPDPNSLLSCRECDSDLCNSGEIARTLPAFGIASLALVIIPLLKNQILG